MHGFVNYIIKAVWRVAGHDRQTTLWLFTTDLPAGSSRIPKLRVYFVSVRQNLSIRSRPFSMLARLVA